MSGPCAWERRGVRARTKTCEQDWAVLVNIFWPSITHSSPSLMHGSWPRHVGAESVRVSEGDQDLPSQGGGNDARLLLRATWLIVRITNVVVAQTVHVQDRRHTPRRGRTGELGWCRSPVLERPACAQNPSTASSCEARPCGAVPLRYCSPTIRGGHARPPSGAPPVVFGQSSTTAKSISVLPGLERRRPAPGRRRSGPVGEGHALARRK